MTDPTPPASPAPSAPAPASPVGGAMEILEEQRVIDDRSIAGQEEMIVRSVRGTFIEPARTLEANVEALWKLCNGLLPTYSNPDCGCGELFYEFPGTTRLISVCVRFLGVEDGPGYFAKQVVHPDFYPSKKKVSVTISLSLNGLTDLIGNINYGLSILEMTVGKDVAVLSVERDSTLFQNFDNAAALLADLTDLIEETRTSAGYRHRITEYHKVLVPKEDFDLRVGELVAVIRGILGPFAMYYPQQGKMMATKEVLYLHRRRTAKDTEDEDEERAETDLAKQRYVHTSPARQPRRGLGRRKT